MVKSIGNLLVRVRGNRRLLVLLSTSGVLILSWLLLIFVLTISVPVNPTVSSENLIGEYIAVLCFIPPVLVGLSAIAIFITNLTRKKWGWLIYPLLLIIPPLVAVILVKIGEGIAGLILLKPAVEALASPLEQQIHHGDEIIPLPSDIAPKSESPVTLTAQSESQFSWGEVWRSVLTQPKVATFDKLLNDDKSTLERGLKWMVFCVLLGTFWYEILNIRNFSLMLFAVQAIFLGFGVIFAFLLHCGITNFFAEILGGHGTFNKLVFAFAAFSAPLVVVGFAVNIIGFGAITPYLIFILVLYDYFLSVIAVKAVHTFQWTRAIVATIWPLVLLLIWYILNLLPHIL